MYGSARHCLASVTAGWMDGGSGKQLAQQCFARTITAPDPSSSGTVKIADAHAGASLDATLSALSLK